LWVIGMVVALLTTALLIVNLHPEIWKGLLEERNLTLIAIGVSVTAIIVLLAIGGAANSWTGFRGKTVWDLLQLLIVPLMLVAIGLVFSLQQDARQQRVEEQRAEAERDLAERRAQDEALQAYLDQMSQLMLERKLLEAEQGNPVYTLAQARTSTAMARLDGEHNKSVTRFLTDSGLAGTPVSESSISLFREIDLSSVDLHGADLSEADLSGSVLRDANLSGVGLGGANLSGANLSKANLRWADLSGSDLRYADVSGASLSKADLSGSDLRYANLSNANLSVSSLDKADLRYANLSEANLSWAYLKEADLSDTYRLTDAQIAAAKTLEGATMPNGQKYEDWLKSKDQGENKKSNGAS
jgi:uncharacterized protein YjbI with pentapeptide repeats